MAAALRLAGFTTHCASNGAEALSQIASHKPDLIVLDLDMPGVGGLDVMQRLKESAGPRQPPCVIVLTASQERADIIRARECGAQHFLLKSTFSLSDLLARVKSALGERNGVREEDPGDAEACVRTVPTARKPAREARNAGGLGKTASTDSAETLPPTLDSVRPCFTREELARKTKSDGRLKALPPAVAEVVMRARDPRATTTEIASAIKRDQAVALKVLRLANSAAYARGKKVESIDQAVIRIGVGAIRQAVLNLGVIDQFTAQGAGSVLDPLRFWEHSIACGLIAADLQEIVGGEARDVAFTMGLLHDIGRAVLAERLGDTYTRVLTIAESLRIPVERVESRMLSANHAEVAAGVLREWNVSKQVIEPIAAHHPPTRDPGGADPPPPREALMIRLADALAHALFLGSSGNDTLYPTESLCAMLGVKGEHIAQIEVSARARTRDLRLALFASSGVEAAPDDLCQVYKARLSAPFRPLYVSESPQTDAMRIACGSLINTDARKPTIGVVHIAAAAQRPSIASAYADAERAAGAGRLPLLCLSADGAGLAPGDKRPETVLTTPLAAPALLRAINDALARGARSRAA